MERMSSELIQKNFLFDEHVARYNHFSSFISGRVLDCACGIGYASRLVASNSNVVSYIGVDISQEAIKVAKSNFSTTDNKVKFKLGSIFELPEPDNSIDTFISMETLEHLEEPNLALSEIKRVLKDDGFFIGSVPTAEYDQKCHSVYGENPYHITRFDFERLNSLLKINFKYVYIGKMTRELVSYFRPITEENPSNTDNEVLNDNYSTSHGSFLFICSNHRFELASENKIYLSQSLVEYDEEQLIPFINSMKHAENIALEREVIINEMESAYSKRVIELQSKVNELELELFKIKSINAEKK
ncbi:class I SAM-dependent methyltransferase [Vibrio syngnathi]|uniref:S-adenosylmethionine-dependent methyltransferase n=1 Tax=Vibrio syngnathi TaxID=3034029 RepID=A0AA34TR15_9VIBR|nr:class I SAM-dependent methyltransferase [Vibrio syngnathi]ARP39456.1 putative S-adenosylmethionine-dependent methyltransferase [Vibrio syngnathi]